MTIGEKITQRRLAAHLSQEILAERLGVSTQDVSRWRAARSFLMRKSFSNCAASSASPPMNCWGECQG
ncbi:MAG: helix-turn-helix domain-containing protein [Dysosmobacter welbionis]